MQVTDYECPRFSTSLAVPTLNPPASVPLISSSLYFFLPLPHVKNILIYVFLFPFKVFPPEINRQANSGVHEAAVLDIKCGKCAEVKRFAGGSLQTSLRAEHGRQRLDLEDYIYSIFLHDIR